MSTFHLLATVTVGQQILLAGSLIDDAIDNVSQIQAAGGRLWPTGPESLRAAAALCESLRAEGAGSSGPLDTIMRHAFDEMLGHQIVFRPGASTQGGVAGTWSDLMVAVTQASDPLRIRIDWAANGSATYTIPTGAFDLRGGEIEAYKDQGYLNVNTLQLSVGTQLRNLRSVSGTMQMQSQETTAGFASLAWDTPPAPYGATVYFDVRRNAHLCTSGTQPMIIAGTPVLVLGFSCAGGWSKWGSNPTKLVHMPSNTVMELVFDGATPPDAGTLVDAADSTATLVLVGDDTGPSPLSALGFAGTITSYCRTGRVVTTAQRPTNLQPGATVFDATISKPIWWTGTSWVDATGTTV